MDSKKFFTDVGKIPIIGDLIIAFAIIVVLISLSSAGGYFGLEGENKQLMINVFIVFGTIYFVVALSLRVYKYITNKKGNL